MAVVARRQPSALASTVISATTLALRVAGAATDAIPIAKQILNSAAHISAAGERIHKRFESVYLLVEKADIYATQIDITVAGRLPDASLQRRLERLYSTFLKIEALVDAVGGNKNLLVTRVWQQVVTRPNRAETLILELDREVQLFQLLTGIRLSLVVGDTACAVAADARYDGQIRLLRDCDIDKRDVIAQRKTDQGVVVWASARVDGQLMVIRYLDCSSIAKESNVTEAVPKQWAPYHEYLENMKKLSTFRSSHPHIVQLYGCHVQIPVAVFISGTFPLDTHLYHLRVVEGNKEHGAVEHLRLAYKILDASAHLLNVHNLTWLGRRAIVDQNGEPRIGLFDDIVRSGPGQWQHTHEFIYFNILSLFNPRFTKETGVLEQVRNSYLHAMITKQLHDGNDTDCLLQVWNTIQRERLPVTSYSHMFPIISGNLSLSRDLIARAQRYFDKLMDGFPVPAWLSFMRCVIARSTNISSRIFVSFWRAGDQYTVHVVACAYDDGHIRWDRFLIDIPRGSPLLAEVARAVGLPSGFEHSWSEYSGVGIYPQVWHDVKTPSDLG